jgi:hypothetical protein
LRKILVGLERIAKVGLPFNRIVTICILWVEKEAKD